MIETYSFYEPPTGAIAIIIPLHRAEPLCWIIYPLQGFGDGGVPTNIGPRPYARLFDPFRVYLCPVRAVYPSTGARPCGYPVRII